ncbi:MAG: hypothetical protein ACJAS9_000655 [Polaribacter sp.]|jgi:hypothetical protein
MTGTSNNSNLDLSILTSFQALEALEEEWCLLHSSCIKANLTNSFSFVYMAYQHFLSTTDTLYFIILRDSKKGLLVGLFPFVMTNTKQYDFNFKSLSFMGLAKFQRPNPLINQNYTEACWELVLRYTLKSTKVWQMMELGGERKAPFKKRNLLDSLRNRIFMKRTKDVSFESFMQLKSDQLNNSKGYFIKDENNFKLLIEYNSKDVKNEYDFKVFTGDDLDYCFSQIMILSTENKSTVKSDAIESKKGSATELDFTSDFYQKYFCRMAYKNNLSFGMLMHRGKIISIEIGYIEDNSLYLDSNVVDLRWAKKQADVLSLSLFLRHYTEKGFYRCEFLCEEDSRIPFLNAKTNRIENQILTKICLKFAFAFSIDLCARTSHQMQCKIKKMLGINVNVKA